MRTLIALVAAALAASTALAQAPVIWTDLLREDFNSSPADRGWSYSGVQNTGGADLMSWNGSSLSCQWDQSNYTDADLMLDENGEVVMIDGWVQLEVTTIQNSTFSASLGRTLTDADHFRFGAKLNLTSQAQTLEFHQIANFGLYDLANSGPDRTWISGGTIPTAKDFVEFNYFITKDSYSLGRNIQPTIASETGAYYAGSATSTEFPAAHFPDLLPNNTDLFVEVTWDATLRRAYAAIYTDEARTTLLEMNGKAVQYWTNALPEGESFSVTDVAFFNYASYAWTWDPATGEGTMDDLYVQVQRQVAAGDVDSSWSVDGADLATLGLNWSPGATDKTWQQGDFNGDGAVDGGDLALLGLNWSPGGYDSFGVPEPASLCVLLAGSALLLKRKRR